MSSIESAAGRPDGSGEMRALEDSPLRPETGARVSRLSIHQDVVIAGLILAVCVLTWVGTTTFEEIPAALSQGMGPAVFPRLIIGVIAFLALWLAWAARGQADTPLEPLHRNVYITVLAVLAFMGVLKLLGFYAAIFFATMGIARLWGERRWWMTILSGIVLATTTYLMFVVAFKIPLPRALIYAWLS